MKTTPPVPKPPTRARSTLGWWYTATGKARERKMLGTIIGIGAALLFPVVNNVLGLGWEAKAIPITLFIVLALGLNVVVGFAGLLDLGYAAFFAIGAYTMAFLTSTVSPIGFVREGNHVNFFLAMFISAAVAAVFGVLLGAPTLRLRGDYLAIVTLGFGEIVPLVIKNTPEITKGTQGMNPIGYPEIPGLQFAVDPIPWYYLIVAVLMLSVLITGRLRTSRVGRAWAAMREDEVAAASMGVNLVTTKLFAFALGASFSGFAGTLWASYLQVIAPEQFGFDVSIFVLSMIILGGLGNIGGVIAGGLMLGFLDRILFDWINGFVHSLGGAIGNDDLRLMDVSRSRQLIFGITLVVMMLVRPEGLFPSARVRAELHAAEEDEGAVAQERAILVDVER
ncbi:MAG TPA: branched-chain amino acid ABC transporter permease [Candidatus Limnocylindria bacterium]|nr:branched-chain amino acid ABC transporter permease [Candidatus Limnocylindria bacterium]